MNTRIPVIIALCCLAMVTPAFGKKKGDGDGTSPTGEQVAPPTTDDGNGTKPAGDTGTPPPPTTPPAGTGAIVPPSTPPLLSGNLTTLSGKIYVAVALKRVDPDGLLIFHKGGEAKVLLTDLPESVRLKYYDAQKVAAFRAAQAVEAERQAKERALEAERQADERAAAAEKQVEKLKAKEQAKREVRIQGKVIQVVKEGIIVRVDPWDETPMKGRPPVLTGGPDWVFVVGHERQDSKVDGDLVAVNAYADGVVSYTSVLGGGKRLRRYQVTKTIR